MHPLGAGRAFKVQAPALPLPPWYINQVPALLPLITSSDRWLTLHHLLHSKESLGS